MNAWAKDLGIENVKMLPDGNGAFTKRMGQIVDKQDKGMGPRSWRYAMVVDNGTITNFFEEPGLNQTGDDDDPYGETTPEAVLEALS